MNIKIYEFPGSLRETTSPKISFIRFT